jgi:hypothetical protein
MARCCLDGNHVFLGCQPVKGGEARAEVTISHPSLLLEDGKRVEVGAGSGAALLWHQLAPNLPAHVNDLSEPHSRLTWASRFP